MLINSSKNERSDSLVSNSMKLKSFYYHVIVCPLKEVTEETLAKIQKKADTEKNTFCYLLSFSNRNAYELAVSKICCENVYIVLNEKYTGRAEHWEQATRSLLKNDFFDFTYFSFLFSGDEIYTEEYPKDKLASKSIYICNYYINSRKRTKKTILPFQNSKMVDKVSFILGRPPYGPMQKIIFHKRTIENIKFDIDHPYTCDQIMVAKLINMGHEHEYLRDCFYQINTKNRNFFGSQKTRDIIKDQIALYKLVGCRLGILMIMSRTLIKKMLGKK